MQSPNTPADMQFMMQSMVDMQLQPNRHKATSTTNLASTFRHATKAWIKANCHPPPTMRPEELISAVRRTQHTDLVSQPPPVEDPKQFDLSLNEHPYDKSAQDTPPSDSDSSSD
jgi:hypothetical protein